MDKVTFISEIAPVLREMNYRKNGNYWYRICDGYTECINVQGSQWDKNNYFIEIGFALTDPQKKYPSILNWYCRHMILGKEGQYNISPSELYKEILDVFNDVTSIKDFPEFLIKHKAKKVGRQYPQYFF